MTIQRTTVRLPKELLRLAKRKAAEEGRTLTALIEEGLRREVSGERRDSKRPAGLLPVSKATGGLLPGVDLTKISDIQGQDDLEYAERLRKGFE